LGKKRKEKLLRQTQLPLKSCERKQKEKKKTTKTVIASSANAQDSVQDADETVQWTANEKAKKKEGEAEEQRWRRENDEREGRRRAPFITCLLGHRPADDPRCVRRTFPGTHGRASLLSPAVPGDAVGRTDWLATDRPVAFPPRLQGA
jgi:Ni/Co efflux regulator RcnB